MSLNPFYPLSMANVATELGLPLPLSLNHAWVIALAGKGALPVSFSNLLGKTGRYDGSLVITGAPFNWGVAVNSTFFGGTISNLTETTSSDNLQLGTSVMPNWTGNIFVKDNTTGLSKILTYQGSGTWGGASGGGAGGIGIAGNTGQTHNFTILPHA